MDAAAATTGQGRDGSRSVAEDMATVQKRLRASLLPFVPVARTEAAAEAALASMEPNGSWADQVYTDRNRERWLAGNHLGRLTDIARAIYTPGSTFARRHPKAKDRLLAGLDYWLTADPRNDNWWHNEIGVPKLVGELLLMLGSDAPDATRQRGMALMTRSKMDRMTGQNLVWTAQIQIMRGCLAKAAELVEPAYARMWDEVRVARLGEEGIQADASFHQHGSLLYAGGYGQGFTTDVARFVHYAEGTRFALPREKRALLERYVLDGQQWMLRGTQWDYGVTGRELIRPGKSAAGLLTPLRILAQMPGPRQKEMSAFAARMENKPEAAPLAGNRHYWLSDYMAHHRPGYFGSTRMYSTRTMNTDGLTNGENKTSHHLADGAMYLARTGQEYVGIYPVWDWRRVPGTTVEQKSTPLIPEKVRRRGTTRFVGGVSDGMYGCAAMDLVTDDLRATKAWFYFDEEIVCLGTGITCSTANPVFTSLNQTLLQGPVRSSADAGAELPRGNRELKEATWVWHGGMGYVFPGPGTAAVHVRNDAQTGAQSLLGPGSSEPVTKDVFSLWIDHGANVQNGSYTYLILPDADAATTAAAAAAAAQGLPVEITSNTENLQAVWHPKLGLLAAAFRAPGQARAGANRSVLTVSVDAPCLLLVQQRRGNRLRLSVSNPRNEPLTVTIRVNLPLKGDGITQPSTGTSQIVINLPEALEAGKSIVREFSISR